MESICNRSLNTWPGPTSGLFSSAIRQFASSPLSSRRRASDRRRTSACPCVSILSATCLFAMKVFEPTRSTGCQQFASSTGEQCRNKCNNKACHHHTKQEGKCHAVEGRTRCPESIDPNGSGELCVGHGKQATPGEAVYGLPVGAGDEDTDDTDDEDKNEDVDVDGDGDHYVTIDEDIDGAVFVNLQPKVVGFSCATVDGAEGKVNVSAVVRVGHTDIHFKKLAVMDATTGEALAALLNALFKDHTFEEVCAAKTTFADRLQEE